MSDEYDHGESDYVCPVCRANCGPDYSEYADHIEDEHDELTGGSNGVD